MISNNSTDPVTAPVTAASSTPAATIESGIAGIKSVQEVAPKVLLTKTANTLVSMADSMANLTNEYISKALEDNAAATKVARDIFAAS